MRWCLFVFVTHAGKKNRNKQNENKYKSLIYWYRNKTIVPFCFQGGSEFTILSTALIME